MSKLVFCEDCMNVATQGVYYYVGKEAAAKSAEIYRRLNELGPTLAPAFSRGGTGIDEDSSEPCDCCETSEAGARYRFELGQS